jgi:hypothetical protein
VTKYYHGGSVGIRRFGHVLAPALTGVLSTADTGAHGVCRKDRVYVTTDINAAKLFASATKQPCVYEVEPIGTLEDDPDCNQKGFSFQCEKAKVKRIYRMSINEVNHFRQALGVEK